MSLFDEDQFGIFNFTIDLNHWNMIIRNMDRFYQEKKKIRNKEQEFLSKLIPTIQMTERCRKDERHFWSLSLIGDYCWEYQMILRNKRIR